jgi:transketolase
MSAADLLAVLVDGYLRYDFAEPKSPANDRLVFSKGHASTLVYAIYRAAGVVSEEEILDYRKLGSPLEGHPTPVLPWVDVATGSLGQGLPIGVGMALAAKHLERIGSRVWVLCGDSEMAEGSMWEAFEHAAHFELDNLTAIIDGNRLGQRGETMVGWDLDVYAERAQAFGWHAVVVDGHDVEAIDKAFAEAVATSGKPTVIVARTLKGQGVAGPKRFPWQAFRRSGRGDCGTRRPAQHPDRRGKGKAPRRARRETQRSRASSLRGRFRGRDAQSVRRRARGARRRAARCRRPRR